MGYRSDSKGSFEEKPINEAKVKDPEVKEDMEVDARKHVRKGAGIELSTFGL